MRKQASEDREHTSGVGEEEGTAASIPGNEGRITQAWVDVQGGMRVFFFR